MKLIGIEEGLYVVQHDDGRTEKMTREDVLYLGGLPPSVREKLTARLSDDVVAMPVSVEVQAVTEPDETAQVLPSAKFRKRGR